MSEDLLPPMRSLSQERDDLREDSNSESSPPTQRPRLKFLSESKKTKSASSTEEHDGQDDQHPSAIDNNVSYFPIMPSEKAIFS